MQHYLSRYFTWTLCILLWVYSWQVQAKKPIDRLTIILRTKLERLIEQNAFNDLLGKSEENLYILYLSPRDFVDKDTLWVEDLTKTALTEDQLATLNTQVQQFHQRSLFETQKARIYTIYVYEHDTPIQLDPAQYQEHRRSLASKGDDVGLGTKEALIAIDNALKEVFDNSNFRKKLTSYQQTLFYVTGSALLTDVQGAGKRAYFYYLSNQGTKLGGAENYQRIDAKVRGGNYKVPFIFLQEKIDRMGNVVEELLQKELNPGVTANFDVEWNYTSDTEMVDAGITSGQNNVLSKDAASNKEVELVDYTGTFSQQSISDLRLRLGLGNGQTQMYQQATKILVRVTNTQTAASVVQALNDFQPGSNAMLVWLHHNGKELQTSVRFGEGLKEQLRLAEQRNDVVIQEFFNQVMAQTVDLKRWKDGANFFEPLIAMSDFMVYAIKQLQLPEAAWNPQQNTWLAGLSEEHKLRWAFIAGMYNGALQEIEGVPALINLLAKYFYDQQTFDALNTAIASLRELDTWIEGSKKIYKNMVDKYSKSKYHAAHQSGRDMVAILSIVVPITKSGKLAKLADLKTVFKVAMKFKPSARWVMDLAKKGVLVVKETGEVLAEEGGRVLAKIENGVLKVLYWLETGDVTELYRLEEVLVGTINHSEPERLTILFAKDNKSGKKGFFSRLFKKVSREEKILGENLYNQLSDAEKKIIEKIDDFDLDRLKKAKDIQTLQQRINFIQLRPRIKSIARQYNLKSMQGGLRSEETIEYLLNLMRNNNFDTKGKLGGYKHNNIYYLDEGNHTMNAAIIYYLEKGDSKYIDGLLNDLTKRIPIPKQPPRSAKIYEFPVRVE